MPLKGVEERNVASPWKVYDKIRQNQGSFRGSEKSTITGLWQVDQRETYTDRQYHHPACASLRHMSTDMGRAGWNWSSGFRGQAWEKTNVGCMEIAWRDWNVSRRKPAVFLEEAQVHQRSRPSLLNGAWEAGFVFSLFLHVPGPSPAGFRKAYPSSHWDEFPAQALPQSTPTWVGSYTLATAWVSFWANYCLRALGAEFSGLPMHRGKVGNHSWTQGPHNLEHRAKSLVTAAWAAHLYLLPLPL